jgi:hypothetical protein
MLRALAVAMAILATGCLGSVKPPREGDLVVAVDALLAEPGWAFVEILSNATGERAWTRNFTLQPYAPISPTSTHEDTGRMRVLAGSYHARVAAPNGLTAEAAGPVSSCEQSVYTLRVYVEAERTLASWEWNHGRCGA